MNNFYETEHKN